MQNKEFQVEVVCRQRAVYRVQAMDADAARRVAVDRWQRDEPSDLHGFAWCELDSAVVSEAPDRAAEHEDDEQLLRHIQERERRLNHSSKQWLDVSLNDAISAGQAAEDLGWSILREERTYAIPDAVRAGQAVERLCARRQLVCFERPRVRQGERGDIRLYCTPRYLEQLSEILEVGMSLALDSAPPQR